MDATLVPTDGVAVDAALSVELTNSVSDFALGPPSKSSFSLQR
jgi:hypothetical protein